MRLLRLEMKGFGTFRQPTTLEFGDADFFALVGPTGSGKSTVLDALCFALYGSVPRYGDAGLIQPVITLGALEAKVRLDFEVGGERYIAVRTVQRTPKGAKTKEARLERVLAGDDTKALASGGPQVSAAVVDLLGLRFEDFTRCVALPQGDFAQFLRGDVDKRRGLMLRLLNLGVFTRMGTDARQIASAAQNKIALLDDQLKEFDAVTDGVLAAAEQRRAALDEIDTRLKAAQPSLAGLAEQAQRARQQADEAGAWVARLTALRVPDDVEQLGEERRAAQTAHHEAESALSAATAARKAAEAARGEFPDRAPLERALAAHRELAGLDARITDGQAKLQARITEETRLREAREQAETAAGEATQTRRVIERRRLARSLAEDLAVGEPCPVCDRVVEALPDHAPLTEISDARAKEEEARAEAVRIAAAHGAAERDVAKLRGAAETLKEQREALVAQLDQHPDAPALEALIERIAAAELAVGRARAAEETARDAVELQQARLSGLDDADRAARRAYTAQRDAVLALAPPDADGRNVLDDWKALTLWASARIPEQSRLAAGFAVEAEQHAHRHAEIIAGFHCDLERMGAPAPAAPDVLALVSTMAAATTTARNDVDRIRDSMERAGKLRSDRAGLTEERDVARLLGKLLEADEFPQWMLSEAMAVLTVDASEILRQLTGGQFSLAFGETEFVVVDHANADERRPARTLSGGETFQASLALALALAQQLRTLAAEGAPRLDAIFLDEGFGTLDPETLDVVAATIENLGQSGRMVGIVTHVSELAARVPVRFKVSKGLGSSVVVKEYA